MFKIVNKENLNQEHICCSLNEKKGEKTTSLKKEWLNEQFDHQLIFEKLDVRGKVFIEYMPVEYAFSPVIGHNDLFINCLWVSGQYKDQGYGKMLIERCIETAKDQNKDGIIALSAEKKRHFMVDGDHLKKMGFQVVEKYAPDFELLYYPLQDKLKPRLSITPFKGDHCLYYTHQCPHTEKYVQLVKSVAESYGIDLEVIRLKTSEEAKQAPCPFTTYALFLDGNFVTTEVLTEKKFIQLLKKHMLIE
ncbi:MAG: GNAT family N-acetyltransferase [Clostridia bacterium]|nr:GNAT family N-acetyltransferase [Clostridia bacterium]